jgi:hypothetical protein
MMLVSSIIPGDPVQVACDLTAAQIAACAHALRADRASRFRNAEMTADDTVALRGLTTLVDRFEALAGHGAHDTVQLTAAHLVQLRDAIREFVVACGESDAVTEESRSHLPAAAALIDPLSDLAEQAMQAALATLPEVALDDSDFDRLLGG